MFFLFIFCYRISQMCEFNYLVSVVLTGLLRYHNCTVLILQVYMLRSSIYVKKDIVPEAN